VSSGASLLSCLSKVRCSWFLAFQLACIAFPAGELVSPHNSRGRFALRAKRSSDACVPNPCQHHGGCQVIEDRPICSCKPGFTGAFCQGRAWGASKLSLPTGTKKKGDGQGGVAAWLPWRTAEFLVFSVLGQPSPKGARPVTSVSDVLSLTTVSIQGSSSCRIV